MLLEPRLAERTAKLSLQLQDDLPAVQADSDQMTQVLQNLMDNAVKYGGGSAKHVMFQCPVSAIPANAPVTDTWSLPSPRPRRIASIFWLAQS